MKYKKNISDSGIYGFGNKYILSSLVAGIVIYFASWFIFSRYLSGLFKDSRLASEGIYIILSSATTSLIVAHIPFALKTRKIVSNASKAMKGMVLLLDTVSVGVKTGSTIVESLQRASISVTSEELRKRIKIALAEIELGESFDKAIYDMVKGLPKSVSESLKVLIPASRAGSSASTVLQLARDFVRKLMMFDEVRKTSLSLYLYIALISMGIFEVGGVFLLYLSGSMATAAQGSIEIFSVNYAQTWLFLYSTGILLSIFSSLFSAKVIRGRIKLYADYLEVFLTINYIIMGIIPLFL
ncbi:MAG: hypothetical protein GU347_04065 [Desulfurococcales archaeon]|nr:hypothetical protein [Desulfurococcales archaeon]